ncbi:hypothetical protein HDU76_007690 [Blyttiomyces sp. JEL0837]|nr:hypothetical protein HDU76_007690 [Blyttiomyces sp. JEL0837]
MAVEDGCNPGLSTSRMQGGGAGGVGGETSHARRGGDNLIKSIGLTRHNGGGSTIGVAGIQPLWIFSNKNVCPDLDNLDPGVVVRGQRLSPDDVVAFVKARIFALEHVADFCEGFAMNATSSVCVDSVAIEKTTCGFNTNNNANLQTWCTTHSNDPCCQSAQITTNPNSAETNARISQYNLQIYVIVGFIVFACVIITAVILGPLVHNRWQARRIAKQALHIRNLQGTMTSIGSAGSASSGTVRGGPPMNPARVAGAGNTSGYSSADRLLQRGQSSNSCNNNTPSPPSTPSHHYQQYQNQNQYQQQQSLPQQNYTSPPRAVTNTNTVNSTNVSPQRGTLNSTTVGSIGGNNASIAAAAAARRVVAHELRFPTQSDKNSLHDSLQKYHQQTHSHNQQQHFASTSNHYNHNHNNTQQTYTSPQRHTQTQAQIQNSQFHSNSPERNLEKSQQQQEQQQEQRQQSINRPTSISASHASRSATAHNYHSYNINPASPLWSIWSSLDSQQQRNGNGTHVLPGTLSLSRPIVNGTGSTTTNIELKPPRPHIAVYDYKPQLDDEVELKRGDVVVVQDIFSDGWVKGLNLSSGVEGTFPVSCIAPASESDEEGSGGLDDSLERRVEG